MKNNFPKGEDDRWVEASRFWRREREVERLSAMDSKPEISSSRDLSSWVSAFPLIVPMTLVINPSVGVSLILRCKARRRVRLEASISFVASSPACFLDTSDSVTGRGLAPNVCHGEDTAANPDNNAMRDIPIIPTLSRQASLTPFPG